MANTEPVKEKIVEINENYILTETKINGDNIHRNKYVPGNVIPDEVQSQIKAHTAKEEVKETPISGDFDLNKV